MSKGSKQRPMEIDLETYHKEWNRIFGYKVCESCKGRAIFKETIMVKDSESSASRKVTFKRACLTCKGEGRIKLNNQE